MQNENQRRNPFFNGWHAGMNFTTGSPLLLNLLNKKGKVDIMLLTGLKK